MSSVPHGTPKQAGETSLRELHLAATSVGAPHGTPAAIRSMFVARSRCKQQSRRAQPLELLTYDGLRSEGVPNPLQHDTPAPVHLRGPRRSGPTLRKFASTASLGRVFAQTLRCSPGRGRSTLVLAHHVEAALLARVLHRGPWLFLAHTELKPELPSYLATNHAMASSVTAFGLGAVGRGIDRMLVAGAPRVAAVAPALAERLSNACGRHVPYLPMPWPPTGSDERPFETRASSQGRSGPIRLLFAGNLDPYQGSEQLVSILKRLRDMHGEESSGTELTLLTNSDPSLWMQQAHRAGVADAVHLRALRGEESRVDAYRHADIAVIPRKVPGGVSIKLLDALARGMPTVVTRRAAAGLCLGSAAKQVEDDPHAVAQAVTVLARNPRLRDEMGAGARNYVRNCHSPALFSERLNDILETGE